MNRKTSTISLNCTLSAPPTTLPGVHTPNTPEILNTIVNITSQMCQQLAQHEPSNKPILHPLSLPSPSYSDISDSTSLCSPLSSYSSLPNSHQQLQTAVQDFHSQFVKDGLKMKVKQKQKLKMETEDSLQELLSQNIKKEREDLSPEDEVRRHKRRERNKVAAEKCRIKKKKETLNLFAESESVVRANNRYKADIARLEAEQRHIKNILAQHQTTCKKQMRGYPSATQTSWHTETDQPNTFRIPVLPASEINNSGKIEPLVKTETKDIVILDSDYSAVKSDCQMESEEQRSENVFQPCRSARSTPGQ